MQETLESLKSTYEQEGYISGVRIVSTEDAAAHRKKMENAERVLGPVHYKTKIHTLLNSPYELATQKLALDIVEQCIGPDILLFNCTYIIKEPASTSHVSWHQDLTYWGLSHDDQVTMWLALSPATDESGCMQMLPASHLLGRANHTTTYDESNVLLQGQTIKNVDEQRAQSCPLRPGEASFHHGWTQHASMPNTSNDRRIGLNVQYIAPHVRQTKHELDSAILVRGADKYQHFKNDELAESDLDPTAIARHEELQRLYLETAGTS